MKEFIKNNWQVTVYVRNSSKLKTLENLGVKIIEGTFDDTDLLLKESQNHDVIIDASSSNNPA